MTFVGPHPGVQAGQHCRVRVFGLGSSQDGVAATQHQPQQPTLHQPVVHALTLNSAESLCKRRLPWLRQGRTVCLSAARDEHCIPQRDEPAFTVNRGGTGSACRCGMVPLTGKTLAHHALRLHALHHHNISVCDGRGAETVSCRSVPWTMLVCPHIRQHCVGDPQGLCTQQLHIFTPRNLPAAMPIFVQCT